MRAQGVQDIMAFLTLPIHVRFAPESGKWGWKITLQYLRIEEVSPAAENSANAAATEGDDSTVESRSAHCLLESEPNPLQRFYDGYVNRQPIIIVNLKDMIPFISNLEMTLKGIGPAAVWPGIGSRHASLIYAGDIDRNLVKFPRWQEKDLVIEAIRETCLALDLDCVIARRLARQRWLSRTEHRDLVEILQAIRERLDGVLTPPSRRTSGNRFTNDELDQLRKHAATVVDESRQYRSYERERYQMRVLHHLCQEGAMKPEEVKDRRKPFIQEMEWREGCLIDFETIQDRLDGRQGSFLDEYFHWVSEKFLQ